MQGSEEMENPDLFRDRIIISLKQFKKVKKRKRGESMKKWAGLLFKKEVDIIKREEIKAALITRLFLLFIIF